MGRSGGAGGGAPSGRPASRCWAPSRSPARRRAVRLSANVVGRHGSPVCLEAGRQRRRLGLGLRSWWQRRRRRPPHLQQWKVGASEQGFVRLLRCDGVAARESTNADARSGGQSPDAECRTRGFAVSTAPKRRTAPRRWGRKWRCWLQSCVQPRPQQTRSFQFHPWPLLGWLECTQENSLLWDPERLCLGAGLFFEKD